MTRSRHSHRPVWAVVNLKGGTSKTTTAVFLAHALHEQGKRVLLLDADPQGSLLTWNEYAPEPFPFKVAGLPSRDLHMRIADIAGPDIDAVVIDTPPLDQQSGVVTSSLRVATLAIAPVAPTPMEVFRLPQLTEAVQDAAGFRPGSVAVPVAVLLTRTVPNATSTAAYREQMEADGRWVLGASVGRLERYAQAYGDNVTGVTGTAYGDAAIELMERENG